MAAFVPRALAKRQKVSLPVRNFRTLRDAGKDDKDSARTKEGGLSIVASVEEDTIGSESNLASKKIDAALALGTTHAFEGATRTSAGLQSWEKTEITEDDVTVIAPLDEGPDALPIVKQQVGGKKARLRTLSGDKTLLKGSGSQARISSETKREWAPSEGRLENPVLNGAPKQCLPTETPLSDTAAAASSQNCTSNAESAALDSVRNAESAAPESTRNAESAGPEFARNAESAAPDPARNAESAASPSGKNDAVAEQFSAVAKYEGALGDGMGGRTMGGPKKQAGKQTKKVFPYGNYDRYYGYRFGKTLSEDPRLSVFQKEWFEGKACLDVGCNEGYVTIAVAQLFQCASMVGVDIDGSLVAKARSHLNREAAPSHQAKKPRLDLTGQADQPQVKQTPLGGTHTKFIGQADQSRVKQTLLGVGQNLVLGHADRSGVKLTLTGRAPSGGERTDSGLRKRKWVTLNEQAGSEEIARLERNGISAPRENGQEARGSEIDNVDVSERDVEKTAGVTGVGVMEVCANAADAESPAEVGIENAPVIVPEQQGASAGGGTGAAEETADVMAGTSGADVSEGKTEWSADVGNKGTERSADFTNGAVRRGADVSNGDVERGDDVSNGGVERGDDVSNGGTERRIDVSAVELVLEGGGDSLDHEQSCDERRVGSTPNGQAAGLALVTLTEEEAGTEAGVNRLGQDHERTGKHVGEDATCPDAAGPSAVELSREQRPFPHNVRFRKENFVESPVEEGAYDVVMSLSVVKWIHLNWGDAGLLRFFAKVYKTLKPGGLFILEPQPWKSYRNNRGVSKATQRHFKEIKITPDQFPDVLKSQIGFRTADIVTPAVPGSLGGFGRAIHLYRK